MTLDPQVNSSSLISSTQDVPTFDKDAVRAWIDLVHGTSPGLIHICSAVRKGLRSNWTGRTFSEGSDAADYVERLNANGDEGIYMRTTTLARVPGVGQRGTETDSLSLPGFAGDIDIAGPGHKHNPDKYDGRDLPPDVDTAMSIVLNETGLPVPTLFVHSGGGIYPWWMFSEVLDVSDPEMMARAQDISNKIDKILHFTFLRLGWHYGTGINDAARVLRIPGTINRKEGLARPCRVIEPAAYNFTTFEELERVVNELAETVIPAPAPILPQATTQIAPRTFEGLSPLDDFEARTPWSDQMLLGGAGWTFMYQRGSTSYWRRPGKTEGEHSATTGRDAARDRLYVFSSDAAPFDSNEPITKPRAYALLHHGGDNSAAAKELRRLGFGDSRPQSAPSSLGDLIRPADNRGSASEARHGAQGTPADIPAIEEVVTTTEVVDSTPVASVKKHGFYRPSDMGNGHRMADMFGDRFKWCADENLWYEWDGKLWRKDETQSCRRAAEQMTEAIFAEAKVLSGEDEKAGAALAKHALSSQSLAKIKASIEMFSMREGVTAPSSHFDAQPNRITVHNGTFDLRTGQLSGFDSTLMARRMLNATYNPQATAPQFDAFLAKVLPDPTMRAYIQRAMGYTLLGEVNQKAMFVLWGPGHTGKSQFLILMEKLFGDFGSTAAVSAFRETKNESSNNLHDLKGKRFVTTSETSEHSKLNEELIKRLTGKDNVVSRQLYEKNLTWTPEMTIWMATNFLPKLSGDDDAMWRRVKPIHFNTVFSDQPGHANAEVVDIAETIFGAEASGILNWLLAGVKAVIAGGLAEPTVVKDAVAAYKLESNNVAEFIEDALALDILAKDEDPLKAVEMGRLFKIYEEWCKRNRIDHPYGQKRFGNRIRSLGYEVRKISSMKCIGLAAGIRHGILGTM